jgi:hypothetical protein
VDVVVEVRDDPDAESLVLDLQAAGFRVLAAVEQDSVHRLATARLVSPGGTERGVVVDLLFASSGIEREVARAADSLEILAGLRVPVARIGHLIALKLLARDDRRRPQDLDDLRALLRESSPVDLDEAKQAVQAMRHEDGPQAIAGTEPVAMLKPPGSRTTPAGEMRAAKTAPASLPHTTT